MSEILSTQNLSKYYSSARSVVVGLNQINLSFSIGEFVAVTGDSGSGKSTLAHVLGGILPYESGELFFDGKPTSHYDGAGWESYRRDCVSFISQNYGILPGNTVLSNVISALRLSGIAREKARSEAEAILKEVELWELRGRRAAKLSSGQKQRLSIARALAKPAPILIADEPTGNLDPENSAKVISLLAKAAKDRLVILITHEFSEAEAFVTRHITIHDGCVTMDSVLREAPLPAAEYHSSRVKRKSGLKAYIAGLQLRSRPVWSVLMAAFFTLTVFAVFAFAGTFISSLDSTPTRLYDSSAFPNGNNRRIAVCRADGANMTQEDEALLLSLDHVESLERYSYLMDIKYAYREGTDFQLRYSLENNGSGVSPDYSQVSSVSFVLSKMPFAKTVPQFSDGRDFLSAGRLPENAYEVVAAGENALIGSKIPVYFHNEKNWNRSAYLYFEVTVVGVTDSGSGLYFHEDVGKIFLAEALMFDSYLETNRLYFVYVPAYDLSGNEARCEKGLYMDYKSRSGGREDIVTSVPFLDTVGTTYETIDLSITGYHPSTSIIFLEVSPENFEKLTHRGSGNQISLMLEDYAYTDRVLEKLHSLGYAAVSPYREGSTIQDAGLAAQRMQTLRVCAAALAVVVILQVVVLRAMFGFETESYRLLSNIGLDRKTARSSVFLQVLFFAVVGEIIGFASIFLLGAFGAESVARLLHYLPAHYCLMLSAIHLAVCLAAAFWVTGAMERRVYQSFGPAFDLDWEEIGGEVRL